MFPRVHLRRRKAKRGHIAPNQFQIVRLAVKRRAAFAACALEIDRAVAGHIAHDFEQIGQLRRIIAQRHKADLPQMFHNLRRAVSFRILAELAQKGGYRFFIQNDFVARLFIRNALERQHGDANAGRQLLQRRHALFGVKWMIRRCGQRFAGRRGDAIDRVRRFDG